jgi:DNA-binding YbaB/EbfC family protein
MFDKLKDLGGLMQQAQQMQQKMKELQDQLERQEIVGSSGAGLVKVTVNGKNETRRIEIDASLFKPEDKGVVEDLIVAAANDARGKVEADGAGADEADHRRPAAAAGVQALGR